MGDEGGEPVASSPQKTPLLKQGDAPSDAEQGDPAADHAAGRLVAETLLQGNLVRAFDDPDSLIHRHIAKGLRDVGHRPIDFDSGDGI